MTKLTSDRATHLPRNTHATNSAHRHGWSSPSVLCVVSSKSHSQSALIRPATPTSRSNRLATKAKTDDPAVATASPHVRLSSSSSESEPPESETPPASCAADSVTAPARAGIRLGNVRAFASGAFARPMPRVRPIASAGAFSSSTHRRTSRASACFADDDMSRLSASRRTETRAGGRDNAGSGVGVCVALRVSPTSAAPSQFEFEFVERQQNASKREENSTRVRFEIPLSRVPEPSFDPLR